MLRLGKTFPKNIVVTASELGGGKFANGAVSGAFVHMFNAEARKFVNVNIDDNIKKILWLKERVSKISAIFYFYQQVKPFGQWDYKRIYGLEIGEDIGNFNYGATGAAVGFGLNTLLRAAGFVQEYLGTVYDPSDGHFYGNYPYGDDPNDQQMIMEGYYYYKRKYQ